MRSLLDRLQTGGPLDIHGLQGGTVALFLARTVERLGRTVCCVVPSDEQMETLGQDIGLYSQSPVLLYPSFEIPPYTPLSPDPGTVATRLATLYQLQENTRPVIVLTSAEAVLRRVLPRQVLNRHCELVISGEEVDREELVKRLVAGGYQQVELVRQEGDFSVRGGIIDVYAPASSPAFSGPLRLDFFGDTIESIRQFDPLTQRSHSALEEVVLLPVCDTLFPPDKTAWLEQVRQRAEELHWDGGETHRLLRMLTDRVRYPGIEFHLPLLHGPGTTVETLLDYLPVDSATFILDPLACGQGINLVHDRIEANFGETTAAKIPALPPQDLFLTRAQSTELLTQSSRICLLPDPDSSHPVVRLQCGDHSLLAQEIDLQRKKRGLLGPLIDRLTTWQGGGDRVIVAARSSRQLKHLAELFTGYALATEQRSVPLDLDAPHDPSVIELVDYPLSRGFDLADEQLHLLSAMELFGEKRLRPRGRKRAERAVEAPVQVEELNHGDLVVHRDHGIGRFMALVNLAFGDQRGDFMELHFKGEDKLYVPVDRLHLISRYQGLTDQQPRLDSLGSTKWLTTKKKVTDAVWQVAQELLQIYAQREARKGHRFAVPGKLYTEMEESFPFDETPGQAKAIAEVLDDLCNDQPMDRLVCGDVGYGKTEVAARAAFKAIEDGFQVALLVPTTVLAEQHAATFRERFANFPIEVACLNRFRTNAERRDILKRLAAGSLDVVIGTHRLLSKDVTFSRLGLLIVDEEHRFGVAHKEKIKKLKATVDVLTLTATPIPRTLQMSLLGIRDLSVISTPPQERRAVKTFLAKYDQLVIREAVLRELQRGGQVFFVHNRVRTIHRAAETIQQLMPQARIGVAHGQMAGQQLEEVMVRFINHELDILVCTTIVESGLDIGNANTIIINRADHLGLADIYQLRGRVGRSSKQSYAYLLVPSLDDLTGEAQKRLRALMDCSELGAGFKLAMNDLQIRGGGNLLGVSQSGHIAAVGYDLYLELLQATVADLKRQQASGIEGLAEPLDPEVKLQVSAFLPEDYITDGSQRYHAYRRLSAASLSEAAMLDDLEAELEDRYGALPQEARVLFRIIGLKQQLRPLGIDKLEQGPDCLVFSFTATTPVQPELLVRMMQQRPSKNQAPMRLTPDNRLIVPLPDKSQLFVVIDSALQQMGQGGP